MARTISTSITIGVTLTLSDNPLTIAPSGYVSGPDGIDGPAGTSWNITNQNTIVGTTKYGISLAQGGTVTNATGASIYGPNGGVYIYASTAGTDKGLVVNSGTISGATAGLGLAIYLKSNGEVTNTATGVIKSGSGVRIGGTNALVSNLGRITAYYNNPGGYGVYLREGGTVLNGQDGPSTAMIQGYAGVIFQSSPITLPGTLYNYGTILGTGSQRSAVNVSGGGQLINGGSGATAAFIQGGFMGVAFGLGATVTNFATISATGSFGGETGVYISSGPAIVSNLGASALITGYIGVSVAYGTVTNSGKITSTQGASGTAVRFGGGSNLLVVDPEAVFVGIVQGSGYNTNTVELSGNVSGTITNFGTSFTNFGTILVDAGAKWTMDGAISIKDTAAGGAVTIGTGADLEVTGALSTADAFALNGGTLHITGVVDPASTFGLTPATGDDLILDSVAGTSFGNAITGFASGDTIALPGVSFAAGGSVTKGAGSLSIPLQGGGSFTFSNITTQGNPAFVVGANSLTATVACFAEGTRIRTDRGEVPVEALSAGDRVVLASGGISIVTWIGHRAIDCRRHPNPRAVWPVRVAADALGDGLPVRDLMLSPDHALYLHGMLIPVRLLINGATITQVPADRVVYYHVELPRHDLLLAEEVPTESYLDTGNRGMFENGGQPLQLYPGPAAAQTARETGSCAPFGATPEQVEPVWRALADRAWAMGHAMPAPPVLSDEPDLHILVGSRRFNPITVRDDCYRFVIPACDARARLVSRVARPSDAHPWMSDDRLLGVKIQRLTFRQGHEMRDVALDDPTLDRGWWPEEYEGRGPSRWTSGDATLPSIGAGMLDVTLCGTMRYASDRDEPAPDRVVRVA